MLRLLDKSSKLEAGFKYLTEIEDGKSSENANNPENTVGVTVAPGVGFEPTWPKGPQAFKQPLQACSIPGFPHNSFSLHALGDPGTKL